MIEGGWDFIWFAYAASLGALGVLSIVVVARLLAWSRRARDLDKQK
jgi:hypothetical protein